MRNFFLIGFLLLFSFIVNAQNRIIGKVSNKFGKPLVGATIFIPDLNKGTNADDYGNFEILNIPKGQVQVQVSYIGYANYIKTIELKDSTVKLDIQLNMTVIETEEIVVSGGYSSTQHENAAKIEVLKINPLTIKSTPNFMEALTQIPGVDMISKGDGVSKPVIRGLSMNDILVLNNGVRFENYQYSSHHPLGINEFGISSVEVIKGPSSLLYGSDAIGGVINFIREKPAPVGSLIGDYNLNLYSNSLGMTNNLGIKGSSKKFFGGLRVGQKTNADYLQGGGDFVPNSRFNELSVKANVGYTDKNGVFKLSYDYGNQKLGLVEDHAVESITVRGRKVNMYFQEFNTHLLSSQNKLYMGNFKLALNGAYQSTELTHVGEVGEFELQMRLSTFTYEAKLHLPSGEKSNYIIGFQGLNQTNTNINERETILLPDAQIYNYSLFGLLQHTFFNKLRLQMGLRYDTKNICTQAVGLPIDSLAYRAPLDNNYGSFTGSIGATYNLSKELLFRANFASAYRTPNLAELTSKGQHELRFELGDANLVPENAYEADISIHYHNSNITLDLAGFYNRIDNYIFIAPTGDSTQSALSIFKYKQENSFLYGGEAGIHLHPNFIKWLHFISTFSTVIGKQVSGDYLPFIPANKLKFEFRGENPRVWFLSKAFAAVNIGTAFAQNHPAPEESPSNSYTLIDLSIGGSIKLKGQFISISISANNIMDTKYIDHLSTLKEVSLFDPGRNISLNLKIPFGIIR